MRAKSAISRTDANINTQNSYGLTPLHLASMYGRGKICKLLIEKKCSFLQDNLG